MKTKAVERQIYYSTNKILGKKDNREGRERETEKAREKEREIVNNSSWYPF